MVKDHIEKQSASHDREVALEGANETLKETVAQLDVECHRLEGEMEAFKKENIAMKEEMSKVGGANKSLEESFADSENRYARVESENEVLSINLKKCNDELTHARQEAVVSVFKLKKAMESHKVQADQIDRQKKVVETLKSELSTSKANYEEIVKWAKTTEDAHRAHDEEVRSSLSLSWGVIITPNTPILGVMRTPSLSLPLRSHHYLSQCCIA
jgi:chromosome segregation ATPase